ncbi:hypothetical protein ACFFWD_26225 [Bradyrhizobium erythrophlei]|uniref:hypothetical protein n=1 Tax=Bradyrhizobium erythrophlei TaxID=1437360 RepID=UPI0035EAB970
MPTLFAPPEIMSGYSFAVDGSDEDLPKGTHLRIFAGTGGSFPLAPFVVFKIRSRQSEPRRIVVSDRGGNVVGGLDLGNLGVANVTLVTADTDQQRTVRVDLHPDADDRLKRAALLDQRSRTIAERAHPRWMFSAPVMHRLRLEGIAASVGISTRRIEISDVSGREKPGELGGIFGLPIQGVFPWYFGTLTRNAGLKQVERGAPQRLNVMDQPDGPFDPVGPDDELARVNALLAAPQPGGGVEAMVSRLVNDGAAPWKQIDKHQQLSESGVMQFANTPRLSSLQFAAMDPGLARFLGFAGTIDDLPDLDDRGGWDCLAVIGTFAIDPKAFEQGGKRGKDLLTTAPGESALFKVQLLALDDGTGKAEDGLKKVVDRVQRAQFVVRTFVAAIAPVPPWLPPSLPKPQPTELRWERGSATTPSSRYRAGFAFQHPPLAFLTAVAEEEAGLWRSRHTFIEVGNHVPAQRATPRTFGHEMEALSRIRLYGGGGGTIASAGIISEQHISAETATRNFRFAVSDFFGRFGSTIEAVIAPPARPVPPPPILRFNVEPAAVDPNSAANVSPGDIRITLAVPRLPPAERFTAAEEPSLASAILVPRLDDLAAGAFRIDHIELGGLVIDLSTPGLQSVSLPLPALSPQQSAAFNLSARFVDDSGAQSATAEVGIPFADPRPPKVIPSGIGLFWTSAPGPAPNVELKLTWPAANGSLHRVYLTDQQGLGLAASDLHQPGTPADVTPSRGRVGAVGAKKVVSGAVVSKTVFRLLTDPPIKAGPTGAVATIELPRSLSTVQFLRIVPLSDAGIEAPFDSCGIVPIAVPDSRRPVAPGIDGSIDTVTGIASLTVRTEGFDLVTLRRDEPGLFDAAAPGNEPPKFRMRRAAGVVPDPIYAREIAAGPLELKDGAFSADITDDNGGAGLVPFVRYAYWAEVRLPPERNLPAGVVPLAPPGGVTALDPASPPNHPRPVSLPSAPRILMRVPPDPPQALAPANVTAVRTIIGGACSVTVTVANPPQAHAKAVAQFCLAAWSQWAGQPIEPVRIVNGESLDGSFPPLGQPLVLSIVVPAGINPSGPLTLHLAVVDPLARMSEIALVPVP